MGGRKAGFIIRRERLKQMNASVGEELRFTFILVVACLFASLRREMVFTE